MLWKSLNVKGYLKTSGGAAFQKHVDVFFWVLNTWRTLWTAWTLRKGNGRNWMWSFTNKNSVRSTIAGCRPWGKHRRGFAQQAHSAKSMHGYMCKSGLRRWPNSWGSSTTGMATRYIASDEGIIDTGRQGPFCCFRREPMGQRVRRWKLQKKPNRSNTFQSSE